ncbi:MAG TPA: ArsR family transcriptional regulator [Candidatus Bathyarchaeia archaeon]|nr:ArsR family transcriptional regulator [Candidatus Bathyarchaeia archaeon]
MNVQDIITFKQKPVMVITDENTLNNLRDENHTLVLRFLRRKPMTVSEITEAFKTIGKKKSEKSIYRYLNKLIKANLVVRAGKRISSFNEGDLTSKTIYGRYASSFIFGLAEEVKEGTIITEFEVARLLLKNLFEDKNGCSKCFTKVLNTFDIMKDQQFLSLINEADSETINLYNSLNWEQINRLMEFVGWIALSMQIDIREAVNKCYIKELSG